MHDIFSLCNILISGFMNVRESFFRSGCVYELHTWTFFFQKPGKSDFMTY